MNDQNPNIEALIVRLNKLGDWHFKQAVMIEAEGRSETKQRARAHRRSLDTCRHATRAIRQLLEPESGYEKNLAAIEDQRLYGHLGWSTET